MASNRSLLIIAIFLIVGCAQQSNVAVPSTNHDEGAEIVSYDAKWNERNAEIYRFLIAEIHEATSDRIYFITTTPMAEWGENGSWDTIPAEKLKAFPNAAGYRPASEAHLKDGYVLENGTDAEAWMKWISVKRWISETEVEVEAGVWCCPLGGGAITTIYEIIDGKWKVKEFGESWIS